MTKIKLIKIAYDYANDYDSYNESVRNLTIQSIIDWEEVSDEEYKDLTSTHAYSYYRDNRLVLLSMPENQKEIMAKALSEIKEKIKEHTKLQRAYELKREKAEQKRKQEAVKKEEAKRQKAIEKAKKILKENGEL